MPDEVIGLCGTPLAYLSPACGEMSNCLGDAKHRPLQFG